ncbi:hypothetical protein [Aquimarina mytili]|uniref:Uncharacterized protein n=1 Tax=Aquimarina mytili TaxID=874423 RepID=A0A937A293_9FLAO|nr:hypothetical protein [Aquimarina mytili]MBL0686145.1 hypothetical protein [Aquimarina mytili]
MKLEDPIQFAINKIINEKEVSYSDLMEISQGGPEIGTISINGTPIKSYRFGGPILHKENYIYAPVFVKKFLGSGFKLSRININTLNVELIGKTKSLIYLNKIEGDKVYFFKDLNGTVSSIIQISPAGS